MRVTIPEKFVPFKTFELSTVHQAIDVATANKFGWFRGHSLTYGNLTPGVFRPAALKNSAPEYESQIAVTFSMRAPALCDSPPDDDDDLGWLFLMQHHGAPTRLLDWTESILIALYFAVLSERNKDGELWVMSPGMLNGVSCGAGYVLAGRSDIVTKLAAQGRSHSRQWKQRKISPAECNASPLAIAPPVRFRRLANQLSMFTIHPSPEHGTTIERLLPHPLLSRYIIRAKSKDDIFHTLNLLGINHRMLFPDLDGLSQNVMHDEYRRHAHGASFLPVPPLCDGEVQK